MTLPEVDQLRCFVATAEALNFRRAAAVVHLTPAGLGKQVRRLEERLDRPLFSRTTRRVELTADGVELLTKARRALEALEACTQHAREPPGPSGKLTVGSRHELALSWLVPITTRLAVKNPALELNLYVGSGAELLLRVRTGEIDCAVTSSRLADPNLDFERLHGEEYVFVASPRLLKKNALTQARHAGAHTLLDLTSETPLYRYWRDGAPFELEPRFGRVRLLGTIAIVREYVLAELGVAVLPLYFVRRDLSRRRLVLIFPKVSAAADDFRLVFRKSDGRHALFRELAKILRRAPIR